MDCLSEASLTFSLMVLAKFYAPWYFWIPDLHCTSAVFCISLLILQELIACIPSHCYFFSAFRQGCRTGPQVADLLAIPHTKEDGMKRGKITTELYLSETASKQAAIQKFCERTLCRNYSKYLMREICVMNKNHTVWAKRVYDFYECP